MRRARASTTARPATPSPTRQTRSAVRSSSYSAMTPVVGDRHDDVAGLCQQVEAAGVMVDQRRQLGHDGLADLALAARPGHPHRQRVQHLEMLERAHRRAVRPRRRRDHRASRIAAAAPAAISSAAPSSAGPNSWAERTDPTSVPSRSPAASIGRDDRRRSGRRASRCTPPGTRPGSTRAARRPAGAAAGPRATSARARSARRPSPARIHDGVEAEQLAEHAARGRESPPALRRSARVDRVMTRSGQRNGQGGAHIAHEPTA